MIFESVILSVIVGYIRKGKIKNLENLDIKWWYLLTVSFGIQYAAKVMSMSDRFFYFMHLLSYGLILFVCYTNKKHFSIILVGIGTFLNGLVIAFNQGAMPVDVPEYIVDPVFDRGHSLMNSHTSLWWLADVFPFSTSFLPLRIYSIGDFFIMIGIFLLIQKGMLLKQNTMVEHTDMENINENEH